MPKCKGDTRSVVGKAVARTVSDYFTFCQNFVSTVSVFTTDCDKIENRKGSEISTVQQVIRALDVQGEVFLLMHSTVKKTLELTVSTANHSIVQVKGNQKLLLKQIRKNTATGRALIFTGNRQENGDGLK